MGSADAVARQHQRVLAGDVELDREHGLQALERVEQRPLDLRHAAEHERVVDAAAARALARLEVAEQLAQAARHLDLPVMRAHRVHARVEHRQVGVRGLVGQGGHRERGVQQPARVVEHERGLADADGVGAHEADAVARPVGDGLEPVRRERLGGGHDVVADPALALAAERDADLGQHGQVAGAERAELAGERRDAGPQRAEQPVEQRIADPGAAGADLVGPHGHRRPHHLHGERRAAAPGVAAHQPPLVLARILERRRLRPQDADAGARPVEQLAAVEQPADERAGRGVALARRRAHPRHRAAAGERHDPRRRERPAVEDDRQVLCAPRRHGTVRGPMRIATWNVNSVKQRLPRLLPWLDERQPDVVCLQETKLADEAFAELLDDELAERGYEVAVYGEAAWNGVAILSRVGLEDVARGIDGGAGLPGARGARDRRDLRRRARRLASTCPTGARPAPTTTRTSSRGSRRCATWSRADAASAPSCCGDMNIAPADEDVFDPTAYVGQTHVTPPEREALADLRRSACTTSSATAGPASASFTYWDYRAGMFHQDLGMRIDLILAGAPIARRVEAAWIDRQARKGKGPSDHAPVIVDLDEAPDGDIGPVVPPPSAPARRGADEAAADAVTPGRDRLRPRRRPARLRAGAGTRPSTRSYVEAWRDLARGGART